MRSASVVLTILAALVGAVVFVGSAQADVVYSQPSLFPAGTVTGSQSGKSVDVTTFDNFTLATATTITDVHWEGGYFNPPLQAVIAAFTIGFWSDSSGQPGASLLSQVIPGTAGETPVGTDGGGSLIFAYALDLPTPFAASGGTTYWLSIVATLDFPPQWGWSQGTGGDGVSFSDDPPFRFELPRDMAFALTSTAVPYPGTLALLFFGGSVAAFLLHRR